MVATKQDQRRLGEARHDLAALEARLDSLAGSDAQGKILEESLGNLKTATANLEEAIALRGKEVDETTVARLNFLDSLDECRVEYASLLADAAFALHPRNLALLDSDTARTARQKFVERLFAMTNTDLGRAAQNDQLSLMASVVKQLDENEDLKQFADPKRLSLLLDTAESQFAKLNQEQDEDDDAFQKLESARIDFDRAYKTNALFVEAVLATTDKLPDLPALILIKQPAYRARLRPGTSDQPADSDEAQAPDDTAEN